MVISEFIIVYKEKQNNHIKLNRKEDTGPRNYCIYLNRLIYRKVFFLHIYTIYMHFPQFHLKRGQCYSWGLGHKLLIIHIRHIKSWPSNIQATNVTQGFLPVTSRDLVTWCSPAIRCKFVSMFIPSKRQFIWGREIQILKKKENNNNSCKHNRSYASQCSVYSWIE